VKGYVGATFASMDTANFRRYILGQGTSVIGTWMQKVAQAWLVLELTDSGAILGLTAALQQAPTLLLTAWGGLLADRVDKRKILLCTQTAAAIPAIVLGVLTLTHHVNIVVVMVCALTLGVVESLDRPARLTFVSEIVTPERLTNAVTLNNTVQNIGKVVGPAVAGMVIAAFGTGPTFLINAASFLAMIVGIWRIKRVTSPVPVSRKRRQVWEGITYVRHRRDLAGPLILMTVSGTLAYNWTVLLPTLARGTFGQDARATGLMFTAMGFGAVVMGLAFAGALNASTQRLAACGLGFSAALIGTALSPTIGVAYVLLVIVGGASVLFRTVANSLLQLRADPEMRGRVIALLILATGGTTTIGGPLVGWLGELYGPRIGFLIGGVGTAISAGWLLVVERRDPHPQSNAETDQGTPVPAVTATEPD
jgi:MFS family permease